MDTSSLITAESSSTSTGCALTNFLANLLGETMSQKRKLEEVEEEEDVQLIVPSKLTRPALSCNECKQRDSNYRCPVCYARYCSKECYQVHKDNCVKEEPSSSVSSQPGSSASGAAGTRKLERAFPTEDTVPLEKLMAVKNDSRVNAMLENPTLRALIRNIDETQDPKTSFADVMHHPEFCAFSNLVLQIIGLRAREEDE